MPRREEPWKPTRAQLEAARTKTVRDVIAPGLHVLFVGINPGLYTAAVGHHFARPGNRFWKTLHASGFTEELLSPFDESELLKDKIGITNLVARTTPTADELSREELRAGARALERKIRRYKPRTVAFLGLGAYRTGFEKPRAVVGIQTERVGGATTWVLPNPSGLNANYQLPELARLFRELRVSSSASRSRIRVSRPSKRRSRS